MKASTNRTLLESDVRAYFERLLRELDDLEQRVITGRSAPTRLRLACTGELVDLDSMGLTVTREGCDAHVVEFICPRCDRLHESAVLRWPTRKAA